MYYKKNSIGPTFSILKEGPPDHRPSRLELNFFLDFISSNERLYCETYKSKILAFSDVPVENGEDLNMPFF